MGINQICCYKCQNNDPETKMPTSESGTKVKVYGDIKNLEINENKPDNNNNIYNNINKTDKIDPNSKDNNPTNFASNFIQKNDDDPKIDIKKNENSHIDDNNKINKTNNNYNQNKGSKLSLSCSLLKGSNNINIFNARKSSSEFMKN